ncbi:MAG: PilZ domain-containing protein [Magnetococcales bacterium]|nr:PilZ domain-containing protein [Magnetococcales bacterium]
MNASGLKEARLKDAGWHGWSWFFCGNARSRVTERRQAPRYPLRPWVKLLMANGAVTRGRLEAMSTVGAFLGTRERPFGLVEGEEGVLCFALPTGASDGEYRFYCDIPRLTDRGVALRFLSGD